MNVLGIRIVSELNGVRFRVAETLGHTGWIQGADDPQIHRAIDTSWSLKCVRIGEVRCHLIRGALEVVRDRRGYTVVAGYSTKESHSMTVEVDDAAPVTGSAFFGISGKNAESLLRELRIGGFAKLSYQDRLSGEPQEERLALFGAATAIDMLEAAFGAFTDRELVHSED